MKICRGFTLLELMVTVAVVAILTTVGVPGFRDLVQNNRVTTQTNELVTALNFARTEAVKRGRPVAVTVSPGAPGTPGWSATVELDPAGDNEQLRVFDRGGSSVNVTGAGSVTFTATGIPTDSAIFTLEPGPNCSGEKRRQVTVALSGQVSTIKRSCGES